PAMNMLRLPVTGGKADFGGRPVAVPAAAGDGEITVGVRPEHMRIVADDGPGVEVLVDIVEELGSDAYVYGHLADPAAAPGAEPLAARVDWRVPPRRGDRIQSGRAACRERGA